MKTCYICKKEIKSGVIADKECIDNLLKENRKLKENAIKAVVLQYEIPDKFLTVESVKECVSMCTEKVNILTGELGDLKVQIMAERKDFIDELANLLYNNQPKIDFTDPFSIANFLYDSGYRKVKGKENK